MVPARLCLLRRRIAAIYAVGFFLGVAAAPHRHLNSVADLILDGPSDSGVFIDLAPASSSRAPLLESLRLVDDDPCLACFHNDFVGASVSTVVFSCPSACAALIGPTVGPTIPEPNTRPSASRSPPASV
jgi:hypothetical protein